MKWLLFAFVAVLVIAGISVLIMAPKSQTFESTTGNTGHILSASEEASLVNDYLRVNLAKLSPTPPVLGGSFYVTTTTFPAENTVIVNYEDGHIALTAVMHYAMAGDQVTVRSFAITAGPFVQTGNLIKDNPGLKSGVWYLSYDLPGAPGQLAELNFPARIAPVDTQKGERVTITGEIKNDAVTVGRMEAALE